MAAATGFRHGRHYSRTPLDSTFTFGKKTNPADEPPTNLPRESHVKYRSVYQSMTSDADNFWEEAQDSECTFLLPGRWRGGSFFRGHHKGAKHKG